MMDLTSYKQQLQDLEKKLQLFNPNEADTNYQEVKKMFDIVFYSGVLNITDLEKKVQDRYKLELFTMLSSLSGNLAFLVIQILAAFNIMQTNGFSLANYVKNKKCGIAINHLRADKTIVSATKTSNGYKLNGTLRWASGYKIFDALVIGFHAQGSEFEAISSFLPQEGFKVGQADATFVGYGLNTVDVTLNDFFIPFENVISQKPLGNYTLKKSASKTVHFCLHGLALSALKHSIDKEFIQNANTKLSKIKDAFMQSTNPAELDDIRINLFLLTQQIITTAMVLQGGSCILSSQPLQRVYKELIMFNANGLNNALKQRFKTAFIE